jgi:hypothetical protein
LSPAFLASPTGAQDAGKNLLGLVARLVEGPPLGLELLPVRARPECAPGVESVVGVADAPREEGPVEGDAVCLVDVAVGVDERRLGVQDQSVEIEYEGPDHCAGGGDFFVAPGPMQALTVSDTMILRLALVLALLCAASAVPTTHSPKASRPRTSRRRAWTS